MITIYQCLYSITVKVSGPGCLSVMLGSALWQLFASFLGWPVSGSHSIVSGLLGFTLVAKGKQLDHGKYCLTVGNKALRTVRITGRPWE